jgi:uncharacterized membrane protein
MRKKFKKIVIALFVLFFILFNFLFLNFNQCVWAKEMKDCYIKDFKTNIKVNKDSSLLITEKLLVDCGDLKGKHGIFRILPTKIKISEESDIKTPIKLLNITDFSDNTLKYKEIRPPFEDTITWKIGDPNIEIQGRNQYKIKYFLKNAIRFNNENFDELYLNLNGNFWDLKIENFSAKIVFPKEVTKDNTTIDYYTGKLGFKQKDLADYKWVKDNVLQVYSIEELKPREGITVSVTFPKNIFTPYESSIWDKYKDFLWYFLPFILLLICYIIWLKYTRKQKTIIAHYEPPFNLAPLEMGILLANGNFKNKFISASIVGLAVKGYLKIEAIPKKWFFGKKDFKFIKMETKKEVVNLPDLSETEKIVFENLFNGKREVLLSSLKNKFYKNLSLIKKKALDLLIEDKKFIDQKKIKWQKIFSLIGIIFLVFVILYVPIIAIFSFKFSMHAIISLYLSLLICIIFSFIIPKKTKKGWDAIWKIKGFKLYMETAEKYRQRFYEKENIFEKFLPYAMIFGITKLWMKKMEKIYGRQYMESYHPLWYDSGSLKDFDIDGFESHMNSLSSAISSNVFSGSTGAGGMGSSGGGSGGGGGGSW